MSSDLWSAARRQLRGEFVRVVSNDGQVFQGWVEDLDDHRHVLLRDAELVGDGSTGDRGTVVVAHADSIEEIEPESRVAPANLRNLQAAPWATRELHIEDHRLFVDEVRRDGWASSYPVVRPLDATAQRGERLFEIVEGHKRVWAARQAGLQAHPVEIVGLGDASAAARFVADHFPAPRHLQDERHENWYDDEHVAASIEALVDAFGADVREVDRLASGRIATNAERLEIELPEDGDGP